MSNKTSHWLHAATASEGLGAVDRINEILFGLIMVLTFTCSLSAATAGREELSTILWSALGCNVAWGFVDAFMYLFSLLLEKAEVFAGVRSIRNATSEAGANDALKELLPPFIGQFLKQEHMSYLSNQIKNMPEPPAKVFLARHELGQAAIIFLLVFLSTFPVTLPFIFIHEVRVAIRISNAVALLSLFFAGVYLGKQTGRNKLLTGLAFALIGIILVGVTIALGG